MADQITWRDGVPVSTRYDDPYFSFEDGLAETRHVFLAGNDLPARFVPGFHIAELGFGTGLNFLTALRAFRDTGCGGRLMFTSFEADPLPAEVIGQALSRHENALPVAVMADFPGVTGPDFDLTVVVGDARETLPVWTGRADAWFLDGFAPARNPQMWEAVLMQAVADRTAPGGTFATYTAAGHVRRALDAAGFAVERVPGYGRKRHMTRGRLRG